VFWIDDSYNDTIGNVIRGSCVKQLQWNENYFTFLVGNDSRLVMEVSQELNQEYWSDKVQLWISIQL